MFNVAIIGGGVVGGLIARQLCKHESNIVILEKENDVAMGQSKANSGIVHGGYDPIEGSLKAILNVKGSELMEKVCMDLGVKYKKNGTLVCAFNPSDEETLKMLLDRGKNNGVKNLEIISGDEVRKKEPNISKRVISALYVPTGAIVCPYELTINAIGNAMDNGASLMRNFKVSNIIKHEKHFEIKGENGEKVQAEIVINCAGMFSDEIAKMVGDDSFTISPRKGEYILLDKEANYLTQMTIFRTPQRMGKGVLATQTVDGNILLGPTSVDILEKENKEVTEEGLNLIFEKEAEFFDEIPWDKTITQFTGLRAHGDKKDFIINSPIDRFINVAAIESPGLSSAPAISEMVEEMAIEIGLKKEIRIEFNGVRPRSPHPLEMTMEERNELVEKDASYGQIICRCEEITEGEIREALRRNPVALDVDGVKRRTRSGMGRCQGGFCMPLVMELIAQEHGMDFKDVTKLGKSSNFVYGRIKGEELK